MRIRTRARKRAREKRGRLFECLETRRLLAAPTANDDMVLGSIDTPALIDFLLLNDADPDGDVLTITSTTTPLRGFLTDHGNGTFTYAPQSGIVGVDTFDYTIGDGTGSTSTATVSITISEVINPESARDAILAGVSHIHSGVQPGHVTTFGPQAYAISDYPDETDSGTMIAAASYGSGRVIAVPDHQMLNLDQYGDEGDGQTFFLNGIAWLASDNRRSVRIVTNRQGNADWLAAQGFSNVTVANNVSLATDLQGADVFIGWLGSDQTTANLDALRGFAIGGGGLFLAEYGVGYSWWWNKPQSEAPGNLLLREAGIGFPAGNRWETGLIATTRSSNDLDSDDVLAMLDDPAGWSADDLARGGTMMNAMFGSLTADDSLSAQLNVVFDARIESIHPTPATPVTDGFDKALLTAEMQRIRDLPPAEVTAHRTAAAVYGAIPDGAPRVTDSVSIDTSIGLWHSTGFYAAPGEVVTVTVPDSLVGKGYKLRISGHGDNISRRDSWYRVPFGVARSFDIESTTTEIAGAFGGAIYLELSRTPPGIGEVDITVSGAIRAPLFVLGETTDQQWIATIRDHPAPQAELVSEQVAMSVPAAWIRDLDDPTALMDYWNEAGAIQDYVGGQEQFRTGPERFNVDVQISVGLLHSGYPIQGPTWASRGLVDYGQLVESGNWGYFHELGHESQRRPDKAYGLNAYTFSDGVEVTVNIFANASLEQMVDHPPVNGWGWSWYPTEVMQRAVTTVFDSAAATFTAKNQYPFYFQLADGFGWDGYRNVISTYHADFAADPNLLPVTDTEKKDEWLIRWSQTLGFDMTQYMVDHWKLEVTPAALNTVAAMNLPSWMPLAGQDDRFVIREGQTTTFNVLANDLTLDNVVSVASVSAPAEGTLVNLGGGTFGFTPAEGQTGPVVFTYVATNSTGQTSTQTVTLDRARPTAWWQLNDGSGTTVSDASGNGNVGNVTGASWTIGRQGGGLEFDGVDDQITFGTGPSLQGKTDFTVAAWIRSTADGVVIQQRNGGFNGEYQLRVNPDGTVGFFLYGNSAYQFDLTSLDTVNDGQWHHIAALREGINGRVYVDGVESASSSGPVRDLRSDIGVGVGADIRDNNNFFRGTMDDIRIYDVALTPAEIQQLMIVNNEPTGLPTIHGEARVGGTLSVDTSLIGDLDGLGTFTYQWLRDGVPISGQTESSLTLGSADLGARFSVEVRFVDGRGNLEGPLTSQSTEVVANGVLITWEDPAPITYGTPLGATQLNATSNVFGTWIYSPSQGTYLDAGQHQILSLTFIPSDPTLPTVSDSVTIDVIPADAIIAWSAPEAIVYGTPLSATQLNATANVQGTLVYDPPLGTVLNRGDRQTLSVTLQPSSMNFQPSTASVLIDVRPAPATIHWANPADIVFGSPLSPVELNATADSAGQFSYTPGLGAILDAGDKQELIVTFAPDSDNYSPASATVSLNVLKATPLITWPGQGRIALGTALDNSLLNAVADVPGSLIYSPPLGTQLEAGENQLLSVTFTPEDSANYKSTTVSTTISVVDASVAIEESDGFTAVSEAGLTDNVSVQLNGAPTGEIVVDVSGGDETEMIYAPRTLTFTPQNWSIPQRVYVSGLADLLDDGDIVSTLRFSVANSEDALYQQAGDQLVNVTTQDRVVNEFSIHLVDNRLVVRELGSEEVILQLSADDSPTIISGGLDDTVDVASIGVVGLSIQTNDGNDVITIHSADAPRIDAGGGEDTLVIEVDQMSIDLAQLADRLKGLETIDVTAGGYLEVARDAVVAITSNNQLLVQRGESGELRLAGQWMTHSPTMVDGEVRHRASQDDATVEVTTHNAWQNPFLEADVDRSGMVTPLDALLIINFIAANGMGLVAQPTHPTELPRAYYDTSGESAVSTLDALRVINSIAAQTTASGEVVVPVPFDAQRPIATDRLESVAPLAVRAEKIVSIGSQPAQTSRDKIFTDLATLPQASPGDAIERSGVDTVVVDRSAIDLLGKRWGRGEIV